MARVTEDMTTESGSPLAKLADIITEDGTGIKADLAETTDRVRLEVDSTSTRSRLAYLEPDDAEALGHLLIMRAREARGVR